MRRGNRPFGMLRGVVRAFCPDCGDIEVRSDDVTLRRCVETRHHTFRFRCPVCSMWSIKDAGSGVVTLLLRAGVHVEHWNLPLELRERPEHDRPIDHAYQDRYYAVVAQLPTLDR